jgi:hypothetical protein
MIVKVNHADIGGGGQNHLHGERGKSSRGTHSSGPASVRTSTWPVRGSTSPRPTQGGPVE